MSRHTDAAAGPLYQVLYPKTRVQMHVLLCNVLEPRYMQLPALAKCLGRSELADCVWFMRIHMHESNWMNFSPPNDNNFHHVSCMQVGCRRPAQEFEFDRGLFTL
jgi:hypothetical protein